VEKKMRSNQTAVRLAAIFCVSFATFGTANASTVFNITGSSNYAGTITIDTVGGSIISADVVVAGDTPDFTNILALSNQGSTDYFLDLSNMSTSPGTILTLPIGDGGTLVGFTGGAIESTASLIGGCDLTSGQCRSSGPVAEGSAELTLPVNTTPLPATLPLLASGIGALGLFGWRRKQHGIRHSTVVAN
jgi:PEP-CTERM motif